MTPDPAPSQRPSECGACSEYYNTEFGSIDEDLAGGRTADPKDGFHHALIAELRAENERLREALKDPYWRDTDPASEWVEVPRWYWQRILNVAVAQHGRAPLKGGSQGPTSAPGSEQSVAVSGSNPLRDASPSEVRRALKGGT